MSFTRSTPARRSKRLKRRWTATSSSRPMRPRPSGSSTRCSTPAPSRARTAAPAPGTSLRPDQAPPRNGEGDQRSWWRGRRHKRSPTDMLFALRSSRQPNVRFRPIADISSVAHPTVMSLDGYNRFVVRSTDWSLWAVVAISSLMWIATIADHFLDLGWGWDVQIIWIAPIVVAGALLTRVLSRAILRWVGALD